MSETPAPMVVPTCTLGTRKKASVTDVQQWWLGVSVATALASAVPAWGALTGYLSSQLGNRLMDLDDLCATEPDVVPAYPVTDLFWQGQWALIPQWFVDWAWGWFRSMQWSTFCECVPGTGTGTCPPAGPVNNTITNSFNSPWTFIARMPIPHGWSGGTVTPIRGSDGNVNNVYIGFQIENAAQSALEFTSNFWKHTIAAGQTRNISFTGIWNATSRTNARYMSVWGQPTGENPTGPNGMVTFNITMSATFTGTCSDVDVPIGPPPPPPPPGAPPAGGPPPAPADCSSAEICRRIDELKEYARAIHYITNDTNVWTHTHLPVDCPDCVCPPPPDVIVNPTPVEVTTTVCGPPAYERSTVFGPLEGEGAFSISELVGVQLQVEARDNTQPVLEGQPKYLWNLGWVSIMNDDGLLEEKRVTREAFVWMPYTIGMANTFTFTLRPEVVLTATALVAPTGLALPPIP